MGIDITAEEKRQLEDAQYLIRPLRGATGMRMSVYHNPRTGQEFPALPTDPRAIELYTLVKGWRMGPAPPELKAQWEARKAARKAADDASVEAYKASDEYKNAMEQAPMFQAAVKDAVIAALRELGIENPNTPLGTISAETPVNVTPITAARGRSPVETVGSPTETDNKLSVSEEPLSVEAQEEKG